MIAALLATLLFAASSVAARRAVRHFGSNNANLGRICLAAAVLGLYAHAFGGGLGGPGRVWFALSGVVGFGICDTALYLALPRLGPQLTSLMTQCLAAPVAAAVEWLAWGAALRPLQRLGVLATLAGVAFAIAPTRRSAWVRADRRGWILGLVAAAGQGAGAVLSRHGQIIAQGEGVALDGLTVTYQRILPGVLMAALWRWRQGAGRAPGDPPGGGARGLPWLLGAALCGPTLGVACYQWAMQTEPAGVVTAIAALTPLAVAPLAWALDGDRPTRRSLAGGAAAVGGVILLAVGRK